MNVGDLCKALTQMDQSVDVKVEVSVASEIVTLDVAEATFDEDALEVVLKTE